MERIIVGFHSDAEGEWVAELSCGHNQHVRHRPPFQDRHWVADPTGRESRMGTSIHCPLCDRIEVPGSPLRLLRSSPEWSERTVPAVLLRSHRLAEGTWGRIAVAEGKLRLDVDCKPRYEGVLGPNDVVNLPPGVEYRVEPLGPVRFSMDLLAVDREMFGLVPPDPELFPALHATDPAEGGDPACWVSQVCPECGAFVGDDPHVHGAE